MKFKIHWNIILIRSGWPIDRTLTGTTKHGLSGRESNGNEAVTPHFQISLGMQFSVISKITVQTDICNSTNYIISKAKCLCQIFFRCFLCTRLFLKFFSKKFKQVFSSFFFFIFFFFFWSGSPSYFLFLTNNLNKVVWVGYITFVWNSSFCVTK